MVQRGRVELNQVDCWPLHESKWMIKNPHYISFDRIYQKGDNKVLYPKGFWRKIPIFYKWGGMAGGSHVNSFKIKLLERFRKVSKGFEKVSKRFRKGFKRFKRFQKIAKDSPFFSSEK